MSVEEALILIDRVLHPERLSTVQELVFRQCWTGQTYQEIAENYGYDSDYIRVVGSRLWQTLSTGFGEKITKNNIHAVFRQHLLDSAAHSLPNPQDAEPTEVVSSPVVVVVSGDRDLELPEGQVPLESPLYVERPPIELLAYQTVLQPGGLVRIKAPKRMGKTSLMVRMLQRARTQDFCTVTLSLRLAEASVFRDLTRFLQWFCATVTRSLNLPNRLAGYWDEIFGSNYNTTDYFENYLLPEVAKPLVLALDDVDVVFRHPDIASDFFGLLRTWHEKARYGDVSSNRWQSLRLIIVHSTEVYIPLNINQSPFNVGVAIDLPELTIEQVQELVGRHHLHYPSKYLEKQILDKQDIQALMQLIGGNPYLVRLALYHLYRGDVTLNQLLSTATSEESIFSDYLRQQLWHLEQYPQLESVYSLIVNTPLPTVELEPVRVYELQSMGLVRVENHCALPSCELYHQYFRNRLGVW